MGFYSKLGIPYALFAMPLMYMMVTSRESTAWLVAFGTYLLGSVVVQAHYMEIAYRTPAAVFFTRMLLCLGLALVAAVAYAVFVTGNVDQLFEARPKDH
jgi:hypothetical protein